MRRISASQSVPQSQDREHVKRIVDVLREHQMQRAAAIVHLVRAAGMRLREAILADLPRLQREAEQLGRINIQDGTKGGRLGVSAPRWITVNEHIRDALASALQVSPDGSRNLLAPNERYPDFLQGSSVTHGTSFISTTSKVSMNCGQPMHANVTSKSPIIPRPSTMAIAISSTDTSISRPEYKSAMSWGTAVSTWYRRILVVEHQHGIRYGTLPGWRPDRVAYHPPASPASGEDYPNSNR